MGRLEIVPFSDEHLEAAKALLAARHARHRAAMHLLPGGGGNVAEALESAWRSEHASGAVAFRGGRPEGFLVGAPHAAPVWGENVWVESAGHAAETPEAVRDLYAAAAQRWVDEGRTRHYALVPASETGLVDAWFRLSFGLQQVHAAREVPESTAVELPPGFAIRAPTPDDIERLVDVELALPLHQRESPVFSGIAPPERDACREEWLAALAGVDEELIVAFAGDRPVALWSLTPMDDSDQPLMRPDDAGCIGFAVTLPEFRGAGLGAALTDACLGRAAERGYRAIVTDWRATNLLASRFWPRRGFRETFLRLYRSIP